MPSLQSVSLLQLAGTHDLITMLSHGGAGSQVAPGGQAGAAHVDPPVTWQDQPFPQSASNWQVLSLARAALAENVAKPNNTTATVEERV
ncbi:MAG TPA: hypothetical protein VHW01_02960 [Polyangiaceae bacterium]|jgi:hypothetical protein|nr:hypothetical protein [Polyangiaceae bacterium]